MSLIPPHIIEQAIGKLPPLAKNADLLRAGLDLGRAGDMFKNPLQDAMNKFKDLNLGSVSATDFPAVPGIPTMPSIPASVADACSAMQKQMEDLHAVTNQMFCQVMPSRKGLPDSVVGMMGTGGDAAANLSKADVIGVPSVAQTLSAIQGEQTTNARLGIDPDDPCKAVTGAFSGLFSSASAAADAIAAAIPPGVKDAVQGLSDATTEIGNKLKEAESAVGDALTAVKNDLNKLGSDLTAAVSTVTAGVSDFANGVSGAINDLASSIGNTIGKVHDAIETNMHVAMAQTVRELSASNPCMRQVLMPTPPMVIDPSKIPSGGASMSGDTVGTQKASTPIKIAPDVASLPSPPPQLASPAMVKVIENHDPLPPMTHYTKSLRMTRSRVKQLTGEFEGTKSIVTTNLLGTPGDLIIMPTFGEGSVKLDWSFTLSSYNISVYIDEMKSKPDWSSEHAMRFCCYEIKFVKGDGSSVYCVVHFYIMYDISTGVVSFRTRFGTAPGGEYMPWDSTELVEDD